MRTKIISAFPGVGKSYYHKLHPDTTLDSDSSDFSWLYKQEVSYGTQSLSFSGKVRNRNFPQNYIDHIKENIGKYEYIFVSSHKEVREALLDNCLFHYLVIPNVKDKEEYLTRYRERGSDEKFIDLLEKNWSPWLKEIWSEEQETFPAREMIILNSYQITDGWSGGTRAKNIEELITKEREFLR